MEFTGKIIAILQPRSGVSKSGNEWKAQEYVIEDHGAFFQAPENVHKTLSFFSSEIEYVGVTVLNTVNLQDFSI